MDYDAIATMFLTPGTTPISQPDVPQSSARRLRDAAEAVATIGWWSRCAAEEMERLGHGFFDGYVWGRAASLGADVAPPIVVSAFGVFSPELLGSVYESARVTSTMADVLAAREKGAEAGLLDATHSVAVNDIARAADRLLSALHTLTPGSRPLFAALRALPVPESPHGRLWRTAELVREHRGDGHLAACTVADLDMAEMNVLTELWLGYPLGAYSGTRGFGPEAQQQALSRLADRGWANDTNLTTAGRAARNDIELATDRSQAKLISALSTDLEDVIEALTQVSTDVLAAHAAPADPRKRAAG